MNTVQETQQTITRHVLRMEGPITARDISDFVMQVNQKFEGIKGRPVQYDDDYYVVGDEEGLTVTIESEPSE